MHQQDTRQVNKYTLMLLPVADPGFEVTGAHFF